MTIYKVDFDTQKEILKKYNVQTVPVLIYLKNTQVVGREFGVKSPEQIQDSVNKFFK